MPTDGARCPRWAGVRTPSRCFNRLANGPLVRGRQGRSRVARESVRPGQRYRAKKAWSHEWLVEAVVRDREGHPHAKLRSVNDRNEVRTFACSVLQDRSRFELVADVAP